MTNRVLDWLPLGIVARECVRAKVASAVSDWSDAWFPGGQLHATRLAPTRVEDAPSRHGGVWRTPRQALAIGCPPRCAHRLLNSTLDADVQRLSASDVDRKLLEAFEVQLFDDLAGRVEGAMNLEGKSTNGSPSPYGSLGGLSVEIADEQGDTLIWLALPLQDAVPAFKAALPPSSSPIEKLTGLRSAMATTPVSLDAMLGAAKIGIADLQTLAPGDVLVLDTALDESALLTLSGSPREVGRAVLTYTDDSLTLTLQA